MSDTKRATAREVAHEAIAPDASCRGVNKHWASCDRLTDAITADRAAGETELARVAELVRDRRVARSPVYRLVVGEALDEWLRTYDAAHLKGSETT